jgi:hypothetical protein
MGKIVPSDETTLRRLGERYAGGASIRTLMTETGWAYGTVHRRIVLAQSRGHCTMRPRGGARPRPA